MTCQLAEALVPILSRRKGFLLGGGGSQGPFSDILCFERSQIDRKQCVQKILIEWCAYTYERDVHAKRLERTSQSLVAGYHSHAAYQSSKAKRDSRSQFPKAVLNC